MIRRKVIRNKSKWGVRCKELFASSAAEPEVSFVLWAGSEREAIEAVLERMKRVNTQAEWIVVTDEASGRVVDELVRAAGTIAGGAKAGGVGVGGANAAGPIAKDTKAKDTKAKGTKVLHLRNGFSRYAALSRAVGEARGKTIVFLEADDSPDVAVIQTFIHAIMQGADVALNPTVKPAGKWRVSNETLSAYTFNAFLGRQDLQGATILNLPFALSRRGLAAVGADGLAKPVMALAKAANKGLKITAVPAFSLMPADGKREEQAPPDYFQEQVVLGDTLEAIHWLLQKQGIRAGFTDLGRRRGKAGR